METRTWSWERSWTAWLSSVQRQIFHTTKERAVWVILKPVALFFRIYSRWDYVILVQKTSDFPLFVGIISLLIDLMAVFTECIEAMITHLKRGPVFPSRRVAGFPDSLFLTLNRLVFRSAICHCIVFTSCVH